MQNNLPEDTLSKDTKESVDEEVVKGFIAVIQKEEPAFAIAFESIVEAVITEFKENKVPDKYIIKARSVFYSPRLILRVINNIFSSDNIFSDIIRMSSENTVQGNNPNK